MKTETTLEQVSETTKLAMQRTAFDVQLESQRAQRLANDFARLDAQDSISALAKVQSNETTN